MIYLIFLNKKPGDYLQNRKIYKYHILIIKMSNSKYSVNRPTGFICNFYEVGDELEDSVRKGFRQIAIDNGYTVPFRDVSDESMNRYNERDGAKTFRERFGRKMTRDGALALITEMGLASGGIKPEEVLQYMVESDIPFRRRFLLEFHDWDKFTLVPDREGDVYTLDGDIGLRDRVSSFFRTWWALARFG